MDVANMDALKQKLMKCAGDDVEIVSVEKTPKEGAAAMKMAHKDRTSSEVHTMTVKLETAERANKRKMADRKSAAKRRANATDDEAARERARKTANKANSWAKRLLLRYTILKEMRDI